MDEEHYNNLSLQQLSFLYTKKLIMMGEKPVQFVFVGAHLFPEHLLVN